MIPWLNSTLSLLLLIGTAGTAFAQSSPNVDTSQVVQQSSPWAFTLAAEGDIVAQGKDYFQPTLTADNDWLHLEGRYNYEGLNTGSVWAGYNINVGTEVTLQATPMFGAVFGDVQGVAPGYELTLGWHQLQFYSEGEYLFETTNTSNDYFYAWSTLTVSPVDWLQIGAVGQRTRVSHSDLVIDRGPIINLIHGPYTLSLYALNLDRSDSTYVFSLTIGFP